MHEWLSRWPSAGGTSGPGAAFWSCVDPAAGACPDCTLGSLGPSAGASAGASGTRMSIMTQWCTWPKLWGFLMRNMLRWDMIDGGWNTEDWPRVSVHLQSISSVLSSSKSRLIFRVLSAASHQCPERQSSGGYSWGNNALAWGSRAPCRQSERLCYGPHLSSLPNSNKPHGCKLVNYL